MTELVVSEQERLLAEMPDALREVRTEILQEFTQLSESNIWGQWRIGRLVQQVIGDERRYGEFAIQSLAATMPEVVNENDLLECRKLAQAYTEESLKNLLDRRTAGGKRITYNHLKYLAGVKPADRKTLLTRVFKEDLSVRDLAAAIQEKLGQRSRGGRRPQMPKTIGSGLSQMMKFASVFSSRRTLWEKAVFARIEKASPEDIRPALLNMIREAQQQLGQSLHDEQLLLRNLEQAEARVVRVIESRAKAKGKSGDAAAAPTASAAVKKTTSRKGARAAIAKAKKKAAKKQRATARPEPV